MLRAYYKISVFENGKFKRVKWGRSRSFLLQFPGLLYRHVAYASGIVKDIDGTNRDEAAYTKTLQVASLGGKGIEELSYSFVPGEKVGIVVGTGTNAVAIADSALQTRIEHGVGAGQFFYYGTAVDEFAVAAPSATIKASRLFHNRSGGAITINELGIYAYGYARGYAHCIIRDKLAAGVAVANNQILKVEYTIKVTN